MERHKKSKQKVKVYTFQPSASVEEEHLEYVTADVQNCDIHICSCQQFTALLTNNEGSLIKRLLDKLNDSSEEDQSPISLSTNCKPMSERMRDHTEKDLEEILKTNINELLKIIDLNILKDRMSDQLNISEQEVFEEGKSTRREPYFGYEPKEVSKFLQIGAPESCSSFCPEDQIHELLLKRKKGQHLTEDEILFIDRQLQRSPSSLKFMQRKYCLSHATIRRISKKTKFDKQSKECNPIQLGNHKTLSENAKQAIRNYLHPPCEPRCIAVVQGFIESELNETYSKHRIRNFITGEMKYIYKKGSSWPPVYSSKRTQLIKAVFCTELLSLVAKGRVIINLDESSFDRTIRRQFSWLPVGKSCHIINDRIKGRASLILATWNTGEWIGMVVQETINSQKFCFFLRLLECVLKNYLICIEKSPIVILDNARTHSSTITKRTIKNLDMQVRFLAPYCPEVAPIERIFGKIKSKLRALGGTLSIDLSKRRGVEIIFGLICSIGKESWQNVWFEVIKEAKKVIVELLGKEEWRIEPD